MRCNQHNMDKRGARFKPAILKVWITGSVEHVIHIQDTRELGDCGRSDGVSEELRQLQQDFRKVRDVVVP